jgi:hypothetical protein
LAPAASTTGLKEHTIAELKVVTPRARSGPVPNSEIGARWAGYSPLSMNWHPSQAEIDGAW